MASSSIAMVLMDSWCSDSAAFLDFLATGLVCASSSSMSHQVRFGLGRSTSPGREVAFEVRVWTGMCEEVGERANGRETRGKTRSVSLPLYIHL